MGGFVSCAWFGELAFDEIAAEAGVQFDVFGLAQYLNIFRIDKGQITSH